MNACELTCEAYCYAQKGKGDLVIRAGIQLLHGKAVSGRKIRPLGEHLTLSPQNRLREPPMLIWDEVLSAAGALVHHEGLRPRWLKHTDSSPWHLLISPCTTKPALTASTT